MLPHPINERGPLIRYIQGLQAAGKSSLARDVVIGVREAIGTDGGRILMELLEKTTIQSASSILADSRALAALNAQSFIAHDLRRVMSDEFDELLRMEKSAYTER